MVEEMDLDELFFSRDLSSIYKFFDAFQNAEQLVKWMKERPKANVNIEVEKGNHEDIVVVIPTADVNGHYAKEIRKVFKGLTIVFVESKGTFFNFAHSVNEGVKEALTLSPSFIIISNDDMIGEDGPNVLITELRKVKDYDVIFTQESTYHSIPVYICKFRRGIYTLLTYYAKFVYGSPIDIKYKLSLRRKLRIDFEIFGKIIENKSKSNFIKYIDIESKLLCNKTARIINGGSFMIFNTDFVSRLPYLMDETYINTFEDVDLYFRIFTQYKPKMKRINFQIKDIISGSLGRDEVRGYKRALMNQTYFNYKWRDYFNKLKPQDLPAI